MKEANYRCVHCGHSFVYEDRLLRHKCKQMIRKEEIQSPQGQAAWFFYQSWMRAKKHLVPQMKAFLHSKFYGPFIRFAKFVKDARIPDPEIYIELMVALDMPPTMWTSDQIYVAFLEHMDKKVPVEKHIRITLDTLFNYADDYNIEVWEFFDHVDSNEFIQLMRQRKLSPWLLLHSEKFKQFYGKLSQEQRVLLETIIRPKYWGEQLKSNPETVQAMKKYVSELNL